MATGLSIFESVSEGWTWFMGTGAAGFGIGALNLARRWHGSGGWALRILCTAANAILLAIVGAYAIAFGEQLTWEVAVVPGIVLTLTAFAAESVVEP